MTDNIRDKSWLKYLINETLYIIDEPGAKTDIIDDIPEPVAEKKVNVIGDDNQENSVIKELLVIIPECEDPEISEDNYKLLWKVFGAVHLDENDVHIHEVPEDQCDVSVLQLNSAQYKKQIIFDPALFSNPAYPSGLYKIHHGASGMSLRADTLQVIAKDQDRKKALWAVLKLMFEIK